MVVAGDPADASLGSRVAHATELPQRGVKKLEYIYPPTPIQGCAGKPAFWEDKESLNLQCLPIAMI